MLAMSLFARKPIVRKIVFANFDGLGPGCNPAAVLEALVNDPRFGEVDFIWLLNNQEFRDAANKIGLVDRIQFVRRDGVRAWYHLSTASVWVFNTFKTGGRVRKRPSQMYVQTGHGSLGIKRVGRDVLGARSVTPISARTIDLYPCHSQFEMDVVAKALGVEDRAELIGHPRADVLVSASPYSKDMFREQLGLGSVSHVILFAPTFGTSFARELPRILALLSQSPSLLSDSTFLVRLHPRSNGTIRLGSSARDVSHIPNANPLLVASDVVISDYSSILFEALLIPDPPHAISFQQPDDRYHESPGLYFKFSRTPIDVVDSIDKLQTRIRTGPRKESLQIRNRFFSEQGLFEDGNASKRVVERIAQHMNL